MSQKEQIADDGFVRRWLSECTAASNHDIITVCLEPPFVITSKKGLFMGIMTSSWSDI